MRAAALLLLCLGSAGHADATLSKAKAADAWDAASPSSLAKREARTERAGLLTLDWGEERRERAREADRQLTMRLEEE